MKLTILTLIAVTLSWLFQLDCQALPPLPEINPDPAKTAAPAAVVKKARPASQIDDSAVPDGVRAKDYDEIFSDTNMSSGALLMRGRAALKAGNYRKALALVERGLRMEMDDPDIHLLHAEALEAKLKHQVDKDPALFQKVVEKWLLIYRNQVGEEKGMDVKGISVLRGFYSDEERGMEAKRHLLKLTGYVPKMWETNNRYLKRVLKPATTSVTAKIRSKNED
jgi:hypothetical protein